MRSLIPLLALSLFACDDKTTPTTDSGASVTPVDSSDYSDSGAATITDADGDGVSVGDGDCNDANAEIYPGRSEDCNGVDDNCNDLIDEGYGDADTDGLADCMDVEDCDGIDNDGDARVDEGFADNDYDGVADCANAEECNGVDDDADGAIDEGYDADGDGYTTCQNDCDDSDASINPGATETEGDGTDQDCDNHDVSFDRNWTEGELFFTEIMSNPAAVGDINGEWVELYNPGTDTLHLNGLILQSTVDGDWHEIASNDLISVAGGDSIVLGNNGDSSTNGGVRVDYVYGPDIVLGNEGDDLMLVAGKVVIDEVAWDDGDTFPDDDGASMMLDILAYDAALNDLGSYWCRSTEPWGDGTDDGSPTDENPVCAGIDHDGDGYTAEDGDCDDDDPTIYEGAPEIDPDVDNDCDGDEEQAPVAVADYTTTQLHCDPVYLDGTDSYDPDGAPLSYLWTLTSAPADSARTSGDIVTQTDATPTFWPDVDGTYGISLVVNDGGDDSEPSSLVLNITERTTNNAPTADSGDDQTHTETIACEADAYGDYTCDDCADYTFSLDGTDSSDLDKDALTYSWVITSGEDYATMTGEDSATPEVTVTGSAVEYGSTETTTVTLDVTVTDCFGETSTDAITLTMECAGG